MKPQPLVQAAWDDHKRKLEASLPSLTYGSNRYAICVAAAGSVVQFGYLEAATGMVSSATSAGMSGVETLNCGKPKLCAADSNRCGAGEEVPLGPLRSAAPESASARSALPSTCTDSCR